MEAGCLIQPKEIQKQPTRTCKWCGEPLNTNDQRVKYHTTNSKGIHCKEEAKKEKTRLRVQRHYKNNKKEEIGTFKIPKFTLNKPITHLGKHIQNTQFINEQEEIQKLIKNIGVRVYNKDKLNNIQTSYKGISPFEYDQFNITFLLENPGPCPICGEKLQEKDLSRCELICRNPECEGKGGLVIRGTDYKTNYPESLTNKMSFTQQDIADSETSKRTKKPLTIQEIAWNKFYKNE